MFYIYLHKRPNGVPFYVGKGTGKRAKKRHRPANPYHANIVAKYGAENILIEIIECPSEKDALETEKRCIALLRAAGLSLANCTDGGEGASGYKHSSEAKQVMSAQRKGMVISEQQKQKLRDFNLGKKRSQETKERLSAAAKARKPVTLETRLKLSQAHAGRVITKEHRLKLSQASLGRKKSEAACEAMRKAHKNRPPPTEETKRKMSESHKKRGTLC